MAPSEYRTLILAGLLHDVGKLLNKPHPEPGKKHAEYGHEFLQEPEVASLLQQDRFAQDIDYRALCQMVLYHDPHVTDGPTRTVPAGLLRTIRAADGYSAGERALTQLYDERAEGHLPLDSIYTRRYLGRPSSQSRPQHRPAVLSPDRAFPETGVAPLTEADYQPLQQSFRADYVAALQQARDWAELEAWTYSLLERYTWAVPSALQKDPRDVSLFDHARTSCALAAGLYLYRAAGKGERRRKTYCLIKVDVSGVQDYVYAAANVGPGGVAKRLRARSFLVAALTEVMSHWLREELVPGHRLPIAATIFAGGGQFVLLTPNLKSVHENLRRIEREANQWLWAQFQGDLALVFGVEEVGGTELAVRPRKRGRNICDVLKALDQRVEEAKQRRLGILLQKDGQWDESAFLWTCGRYEDGDCPSCGRLPARADENEENVERRLCKRCWQDRILSEQLVQARYIGYWKGARPKGAESGWLVQRCLSLFEGDAARHVVLLSDLGELARLDPPPYRLDGLGYELEVEAQAGSAPLVRHLANYVPRFETASDLHAFCTEARSCTYGRYGDDDTCGILLRPGTEQQIGEADYPIVQTFGCLSAAAAEQGAGDDAFYGAQLLGVLRADADHLGRLFTDSFEEEIRRAKDAQPERRPVRSLSRLATLSRMTDLFFSGWVDQTLRTPPAGKRYDCMYTVYAGGDDLCLVGPWDVTADFARYMAAAFARYTCVNPNVALSAAISVTKPKFPIARSARRAGELLERAKQAGRNRLNLFGVIARWRALPDWEGLSPELARDLRELEQHHELLVGDLWPWAELLDEELCRWRTLESARHPVSPAFLHRLLTYAEMARRWEEEQQIAEEDMLYLARLSYDLGRNVVDSDVVPEETKCKLSRLTQLSSRRLMAGMRLPITYAVYRNRERSRER